jgi:hypothetical protein
MPDMLHVRGTKPVYLLYWEDANGTEMTTTAIGEDEARQAGMAGPPGWVLRRLEWIGGGTPSAIPPGAVT